MKGSNKTGLACRELCGYGDVGFCECLSVIAITGSSVENIFKCVYCAQIIDIRIGGLEAIAGTGDLVLPPFLVVSRKENIEVGPSLVGRVLAAPGLAVFK